jgi:hypothetical protein
MLKFKTKIKVLKKIAEVDDSLETIINIKFNKNVDYHKYFQQFDSPRRTNVTEKIILQFLFKGIMTLYDLVRRCSFDYIYNVSSFFLYVDAHGSQDDNQIYVKLKKKELKYEISSLDLFNINILRSKHKITAELLRDLSGDIIFENREPTYDGLIWILNNIRRPISNQYLPYLQIIQINTNSFTFRTNCGMTALVDKDKIPSDYICSLCTGACIHGRILKQLRELEKKEKRSRIYPSFVDKCACKPIVTNYKNTVFDGEYLVADQSIPSNTIIFQDLPIIVDTNCPISNLFLNKYNDIELTCDVVRFLK